MQAAIALMPPMAANVMGTQTEPDALGASGAAATSAAAGADATSMVPAIFAQVLAGMLDTGAQPAQDQSAAASASASPASMNQAVAPLAPGGRIGKADAGDKGRSVRDASQSAALDPGQAASLAAAFMWLDVSQPSATPTLSVAPSTPDVVVDGAQAPAETAAAALAPAPSTAGPPAANDTSIPIVTSPETVQASTAAAPLSSAPAAAPVSAITPAAPTVASAAPIPTWVEDPSARSAPTVVPPVVTRAPLSSLPGPAPVSAASGAGPNAVSTAAQAPIAVSPTAAPTPDAPALPVGPAPAPTQASQASDQAFQTVRGPVQSQPAALTPASFGARGISSPAASAMSASSVAAAMLFASADADAGADAEQAPLSGRAGETAPPPPAGPIASNSFAAEPPLAPPIAQIDPDSVATASPSTAAPADPKPMAAQTAAPAPQAPEQTLATAWSPPKTPAQQDEVARPSLAVSLVQPDTPVPAPALQQANMPALAASPAQANAASQAPASAPAQVPASPTAPLDATSSPAPPTPATGANQPPPPLVAASLLAPTQPLARTFSAVNAPAQPRGSLARDVFRTTNLSAAAPQQLSDARSATAQVQPTASAPPPDADAPADSQAAPVDAKSSQGGDVGQAIGAPSPSSAASSSQAPAAPTTIAGPPRANAETIAALSAAIATRINARSTRFNLALEPAGLGRVDVKVHIGPDGVVSAALNFDNAYAAEALKARAGELRTALAQAGFDAQGSSLSFTNSGSGGSGAAPDGGGGGRTWSHAAGPAIAEAADISAQLTASQAAAQSGVDIRI
jgi:Meckel syndrome type 1 protein